jgi:hypothetical protein
MVCLQDIFGICFLLCLFSGWPGFEQLGPCSSGRSFHFSQILCWEGQYEIWTHIWQVDYCVIWAFPIDTFNILEKWLESCVKYSSKNKQHLCEVINWLTFSPCNLGAWCNCSTQRETCNCQESSKKGRSTRATIHLVISEKCFSCPLVVGLTMHPPPSCFGGCLFYVFSSRTLFSALWLRSLWSGANQGLFRILAVDGFWHDGWELRKNDRVSYQGLGPSEESSVFCLGGWGFVVRKAQFRATIQLQFDFHRVVCNLGTVLVSEWNLSYSTL